MRSNEDNCRGFRLSLGLLLLLAVYLTGCNPRNWPGFKERAAQEDARITKETQEAIKRDPVLGDLNHLCAETIPKVDGAQLLSMSHSTHSRTFISYHYGVTTPFPQIKAVFRDYFQQKEWELIGEKDANWGPPNIDFRTDTYQITVWGSSPNDTAGFSLTCAKR